MFSRLPNIVGTKVVVEIDGHPVECLHGDTVAAAVLTQGELPYRRTIVSGAHRMPVCMMGVCFDCLVEIDGVPNQQGCLRSVVAGMKIRRQTTVFATSTIAGDQA